MSFETTLIWLSFMVPLLISPGPANITISSLAGSFGLKRTLSFISGLTFWNIIACLIIGCSFGMLHSNFDKIFHIIELLGSFYIFYIAYTFYQNSRKQAQETKEAAEEIKEPSFKSGLLMQTLNGKLYPVLSLMFSQFLDSHKNVSLDILILTTLFTSLCALVYLFWGALGAKINQSLGQKGKQKQMEVSAILLTLVGVWLVKNSIFF